MLNKLFMALVLIVILIMVQTGSAMAQDQVYAIHLPIVFADYKPAIQSRDIAIRPAHWVVPTDHEVIKDEPTIPTENSNVNNAWYTAYAKPHPRGGYMHGFGTIVVAHNYYDTAAASYDLVRWKNRIAGWTGCFELPIELPLGDESYAVKCYWSENGGDYVEHYVFARVGVVRYLSYAWSERRYESSPVGMSWQYASVMIRESDVIGAASLDTIPDSNSARMVIDDQSR